MTENEKKDSLRYVIFFARDIMEEIFVYVLIYITWILNSKSIVYIGFLKLILLLHCFIKQNQLLKRVRRFSRAESPSIKAVYWCYLITTFCVIAISYCKNDIDKLFNPVLNMSLEWIEQSEITVRDILHIVYDAVQIAETSIEIVIIKDVIYQMNNWNIYNSFSEYFKELVQKGKVYILQEDKNKSIPRLWFIRGDADADLVDELSKYHIKKDKKFEISLTEKQKQELIDERKRKNVYDENDFLDTDTPAINIIVEPILFIHDKFMKKERSKKTHEYFFSFGMMDLSYYEIEYIKQEILEKYKSKLLEFPKNTEIIEREPFWKKILHR